MGLFGGEKITSMLEKYIVTRVDWYVYAKLDVPMKMDVNKR
jgi:hypothetical protein